MSAATADFEQDLLGLYDEAVGEIYRYIHRRCRNRTVAEDITTEVFLAAVDSIKRGIVQSVTIGWLIGIARHKLVDHWRRTERDARNLEAVTDLTEPVNDTWDVELDVMMARDVLGELGAHHRSALTLRYVDDLPVREVASVLNRTEHATEALLVRARRSFRDRYEAHTTGRETP